MSFEMLFVALSLLDIQTSDLPGSGRFQRCQIGLLNYFCEFDHSFSLPFHVLFLYFVFIFSYSDFLHLVPYILLQIFNQ